MRIELQAACRTPWILGELFGVKPVRIGNAPDCIGAMATDSREVQKGDLFVALKGEHADGHVYIERALQAGARGVLCERGKARFAGTYWLFECESVQNTLLQAAHLWRERCGAVVIAVTGSAGKTTTKEAIAAVLGNAPHNEGNYNSMVGMPLSVLSFPPSDFWVCELGINHVGEMEAMSLALAPDISVITNVGSAHIGHFGDAFTLFREKASVCCGMKQGGSLLVPFSLKQMLLPMVACRVLGVGEEKEADFVTENIVMDTSGVRCSLRGENTCVTTLSWPIPGSIGKSVIALAGACGLLGGKSAENIRVGLQRAGECTPRMRQLYVGERMVIEDTYNASPEACAAALETAGFWGAGRPMVAIFGDMLELGAYSEFLHRALGRAVCRAACEMLVTYGTQAQQIAQGAREAGMAGEKIFSFAGGEEDRLAELVLERAPRDAVILCKGSRAMRLERVVERMRRL